MLASDKEAGKKCATSTLARLASVNEFDIVKEGAAPPLVNLLISENDECKKNVIQIIVSLSNNDENRQAIIKDGG